MGREAGVFGREGWQDKLLYTEIHCAASDKRGGYNEMLPSGMAWH
jgi:hypothetical protein